MEYLVFSALFAVIHTVSYTVAGMIALPLSKSVYEGPGRLLDYLKDMADPQEKQSVQRRVLPMQLVRGVLLSVVIYPILGPVGELSFLLRFLFFGGLVFVYTDLASADPFPCNIEGYVYIKDRYRSSSTFAKMQAEMLIYSVLFGLAVSAFLF